LPIFGIDYQQKLPNYVNKGEYSMSKYLIRGNYAVEGLKGLLKEGGAKRRATVARVLEGLGGKLEGFYWAFGDEDVVAICEMPDNVSAAALSLAVSASGAVSIKTTVLMTAEEMDQAVQKSVEFRPPGQG
jgi:uncharacterized protein with GYD domain